MNIYRRGNRTFANTHSFNPNPIVIKIGTFQSQNMVVTNVIRIAIQFTIFANGMCDSIYGQKNEQFHCCQIARYILNTHKL